jgi:hypothetical protein
MPIGRKTVLLELYRELYLGIFWAKKPPAIIKIRARIH